MAGFALKLKTKSGQMVIKGLAPKDTVYELKRKLSSLTNIKENSLHVLSGYPPKPIDLSVSEATLESRGICSGDTLIVEEKQRNIVLSVQQNARLEEPRHHIVDSELGCPGVLMKMVVPADNSCLFTSIGFVLSGECIFIPCSSFQF
jgi:ubiquitin thioesterase OTU1